AGDVGPAWGVHAAFAAALAGLLVARTSVLGMVSPAAFTHFIDNPIAHLAFPQSTATALLVAARYARLLVEPFPLSLDYSYDAIAPADSLVAPGALAGAGLAAVVLGGAVFLWRRRPAAAFGFGFMAIAFAPVSNLLVPIGTIMAERLLYLPSVGFALIGACVAAAAATLPGLLGRAARVGIAAALLGGAFLSGLRLRDFHDDLTIQAKTVATTPRSVRAQFNYGAAAETAGDDATAERAYREAIALWPDFADAQFNLAGLLARRGRLDEALAHYREALREQPGSVTYLVNYGAALTRAGRPAEAIEPLERAVGIDPGSDRAWNNLGGARLALGRADEAAQAWRAAIRIAPGEAEYAVNLALALDAAGDPGAAAAWSDAVARRPGDGLLLYRLGRAHERAGREAEAIAAYRESARVAPASPVPRRALGLLLDRRGDAAGARAALEEAERLDQGGGVFDAEARRVLDRLRAAAR
ncbi:MAG TPA: tetratricopeptide repeat protein, partial [Dongiaceae bacterium]|nr:tetratricopeptide repeat protein [Dongiaceae bacterium]